MTEISGPHEVVADASLERVTSITLNDLRELYVYITEADKLLNGLRTNGYIPRHFRRTIATCEELKINAEKLKEKLQKRLNEQ
jgi:hypothetical protein